jgi:hypothetical protein
MVNREGQGEIGSGTFSKGTVDVKSYNANHP